MLWLRVRAGRLSPLKLGFVISRIVCEAFQYDADAAVRPQRVSVASAVSSKTLTSTVSVGTPFLLVTAEFLSARIKALGRIVPTFFPSSDALHTNEHLHLCYLMATTNVTFQGDESVQLFAISITQRCLAQDALVAPFLYHKVAAIVSLWENGRNKRGILQRQGARLSIGDMWCPD